MNVSTAPILVALLASLLLVVKGPARLFPLIALAASGVEALRAVGILNVKVPVIGAGGASLLFAGALLVGGLGSWMKSGAKASVTAATVVALVGLLRLIARLL